MLVVDASVVVKFFVPEADSASAWRLADSDVVLLAPANALGEILEILRRKMLAGDIRPQTFWEAVRTLDQVWTWSRWSRSSLRRRRSQLRPAHRSTTPSMWQRPAETAPESSPRI